MTKQAAKTSVRIQSILMQRDGLTAQEALELIQETREALIVAIDDGLDPEEVMMDYLGLEPDYIFDLIPVF